MRPYFARSSAVLVLFVSTSLGTAATDQAAPPQNRPSALPSQVAQELGVGRFADPAYGEFVSREGLRRADPEALFEVIRRSAELGEQYKALFLSRVLTESQPSNRALCETREQIARALGASREADGARACADGQLPPSSVPKDFLPGSALPHRPTTLADWAGAMALLADAAVAVEGPTALLAVTESVSGVYRSRMDDESECTKANPLRLDDVLPNLMVVREPVPMVRRDSRGGAGRIFSAMALSVAAGLSKDEASKEKLSDLAGKQAAHADAAPVSHYSGGSFIARSFPQSAAIDSRVTPEPTGSECAIKWPRPSLWASGGALAGAMQAHFNTKGKHYFWIKGATKEKYDFKSVDVDAVMSFPKLQSFCEPPLKPGAPLECSTPFALPEVLLTRGDLYKLAPGVADGRRSPREAAQSELDHFRADYLKGVALVLSSQNATPRSVDGPSRALAAYDRDQTIYSWRDVQNDAWLRAPAGAKK